jgi:hypothetical protein
MVRRSVAVWAIVLGLAALLWEAPVGLHDFVVTSLPTQVFYSVLTLGGIVLLFAGAAWLRPLGMERPAAALVACIAAAVLAINQFAGLSFGAILCFSAG